MKVPKQIKGNRHVSRIEVRKKYLKPEEIRIRMPSLLKSMVRRKIKDRTIVAIHLQLIGRRRTTNGWKVGMKITLTSWEIGKRRLKGRDPETKRWNANRGHGKEQEGKVLIASLGTVTIIEETETDEEAKCPFTFRYEVLFENMFVLINKNVIYWELFVVRRFPFHIRSAFHQPSISKTGICSVPTAWMYRYTLGQSDLLWLPFPRAFQNYLHWNCTPAFQIAL